MKTSITKLKSKSFLFVLALTPSLAFAALVGKVQSVKGEVFKVLDGKTSSVQVGSDIEAGTELLVGDDSALTVGDFFDRRHTLGAGTNLTMNDRALVLKKGSLWTQSLGPKSTGQVTTANMVIQAEQGEWITTYDSASQRTQLTAISGEVRVASPQEPAFQYAVAAGMFTLADPKVDEGYPRSPTKLGYDSLMKTLALFPGHKSRDAGLAKFQEQAEKKAAAPEVAARSIASVEEAAPKKGEITIITSNAARVPASADTGTAQSYFMKKAVKKRAKTRAVLSATSAPVRIFGMSGAQVSKSAPVAPVVRQPASVRSAPAAKPAEALDDKSNEFIKSYQEHTQAQPKNPSEVQRLLDDLQSY